jgi:hypothetical protein
MVKVCKLGVLYSLTYKPMYTYVYLYIGSLT